MIFSCFTWKLKEKVGGLFGGGGGGQRLCWPPPLKLLGGCPPAPPLSLRLCVVNRDRMKLCTERELPDLVTKLTMGSNANQAVDN